MACLLKVLSDMLHNPQPLSHIQIYPKPKVKLGPTDLVYPAPLSSLDTATARNPNQFGLTDGISVSPRWACKLSVTHCNILGPTEICNRSHRVSIQRHWVLLTQPLPETLINSVSPMGSRSHRDGLANSLLPIAIFSVPPRYAIGPTEFAWPNLSFTYYPNRSHRVWVIGQTEFWIYPNPSTSVPPSWSCRSHRKD